MSRASEILASAQEHLDRRCDPLEDPAFCTELEETPEALGQVVALRATHLELLALSNEAKTSVPIAAEQTNTGSSLRRWAGITLPLAAAFLLWAYRGQPEPTETPLGSELAATMQVEKPNTPAVAREATPAILRQSQAVRTKTHHQKTGRGVLQVKITSTHTSTDS